MAWTRLHRCAAVVIGVLITLSGCGGDSSSSPDLSPAAAEGRGIMRRKGCGSCHGSSGAGGVGPAFVNLFGSDVALDNGAVVTADRDYLVESITDPSAKIVEGFSLPMLRTELTGSEIDAIIAYIEALAPTRSTSTAGVAG